MPECLKTPSLRLKDYHEHDGMALSTDDLHRVFSNQAYLRRLVDLASPVATQPDKPIPSGAGLLEKVRHG